MGGLSSALAPIIQVGSALGSVANFAQPFYQDSVDAKQQEQKNKLLLQQAQQSAALQKEQNRLASLQADTDRRAALKRAIAKQRANFGAQGIGSAGGSSEAVLLGLFDESEEERVQREQMDNLKTAALDQDVSRQKQLNLLQQAQLKEQQRINRITDLF